MKITTQTTCLKDNKVIKVTVIGYKHLLYGEIDICIHKDMFYRWVATDCLTGFLVKSGDTKKEVTGKLKNLESEVNIKTYRDYQVKAQLRERDLVLEV